MSKDLSDRRKVFQSWQGKPYLLCAQQTWKRPGDIRWRGNTERGGRNGGCIPQATAVRTKPLLDQADYLTLLNRWA